MRNTDGIIVYPQLAKHAAVDVFEGYQRYPPERQWVFATAYCSSPALPALSCTSRMSYLFFAVNFHHSSLQDIECIHRRRGRGVSVVARVPFPQTFGIV